jgi:membrane-bound lytic murein transglycosylase D
MNVSRLMLGALVLSGLSSTLVTYAQEGVPPYDPVVEQLDELSQLPWLKNDPFTTDIAKLNVHRFAPTDTPRYQPDVYKQRLAVLDQRTPFKLTYNEPVQSYLDLYTRKKREQTARMLGLAQLYFPVFEEALDRYGLPQELKYLAVVESALFPGAKSRAAAVGLWQFMIGTGKLYGLEVDSYVDERCDVYASTDAACRYLRDLHRIFGNWELALAAYNCGPGNVNKAVRRAGGTMDYWAVYAYLPRETRGYVPAFIAVNYIFNHAAEHNIYPIVPNYCAYEVDTVKVCYPVMMDQLASIIGANPQELRDLNPVFKQGIVPDVDEPTTLYLPQDLVDEFVDREDFIMYSYTPDMSRPEPGYASASSKNRSSSTSGARTHVVRRGETLGAIARKHGVSVKQLRSWNHLRGDQLRKGQRLVVSASGSGTTKPAVSKPEVTSSSASESSKKLDYVYHTIQPGDTLWGIAQRYPGTSVEELRRLNSDQNLRKLVVGKKLKVAVQKG